MPTIVPSCIIWTSGEREILFSDIASLVGMPFPRGPAMETAVSGFGNTGLWSVDRCVFKDDVIAPSLVTDRPETIQLEKRTADGIGNFSLGSAHAAKPGTPKQTPGYNGYLYYMHPVVYIT
jgi:hypothetical protein